MIAGENLLIVEGVRYRVEENTEREYLYVRDNLEKGQRTKEDQAILTLGVLRGRNYQIRIPYVQNEKCAGSLVIILNNLYRTSKFITEPILNRSKFVEFVLGPIKYPLSLLERLIACPSRIDILAEDLLDKDVLDQEILMSRAEQDEIDWAEATEAEEEE